MSDQGDWMIAGVAAVLVLAVLYGYWVGRMGRRRSWGMRMIHSVAAYPLVVPGFVLLVASMFFRMAGGERVQLWAKFPWIAFMSAGFLAMVVAVKVARPGTPLSDIYKYEPLDTP